MPVFLLSLALAQAGFSAFCLAMDRHREQILRRRVSLPGWRRRALSALGFLLLGVALATLVATAGWGLGLTLWLGVLTAAAMLLALSLTYAPRAAPFLSGALLAGGAVAALV